MNVKFYLLDYIFKGDAIVRKYKDEEPIIVTNYPGNIFTIQDALDIIKSMNLLTKKESRIV
jgi:hypothetical protein